MPPPPPPHSRPADLGTLVMIQGGPVGFRIPLRSQKIILGRSPAATIRVPDPSISRSHCSLVFNGSHWVIADLGSSNGTFVDGHQILQPSLVMPGSVIGIARVEFRIEYVPLGLAAVAPGGNDIEAELVEDDLIVGEVALGLPDAPGDMKSIPVDPDMQIELELDALPDGKDDGLDWNFNQTISPDGK